MHEINHLNNNEEGTSSTASDFHLHCKFGQKSGQNIFQPLVSYLLVAGELLSFLELEGDGSVPPFFDRPVPLLTVGLRGRAAIIGLAKR